MFQIDIKKLLALSILGGFLGIILMLFFATIPQGNLDLLKTCIIALIAIVSAVGGYYFGSSEGSARKTELLSPVAGSAPDLPPPAAKDGGFIRRPLLLAISAICALALMSGGCATLSGSTTTPAADASTALQTAGKSLLAVKSTIVTAATAADGLCRSGAMDADQCAAAKGAYELAHPAYDAAVDSYLLVSQGGDPAEFGRTLARVQQLAGELLAVSGGAH